MSGADLTRRALMQVKRVGVELLSPQEVVGVRVQDPDRVVQLADGAKRFSFQRLADQEWRIVPQAGCTGNGAIVSSRGVLWRR